MEFGRDPNHTVKVSVCKMTFMNYYINIIVVISCGTPSQPNSGTTGLSISYSSTVYNSVATYSCATGYNLIGTSTRTCLSSGSWSGSPAYCQSKKFNELIDLFAYFSAYIVVNCGGLSVPSGSTGGLAVTVPNTIYNSVATYYCSQTGYQLIGQSQRTCQSNGVWSGSQPYCQSRYSEPMPYTNS